MRLRKLRTGERGIREIGVVFSTSESTVRRRRRR
jgi:hypothetical protein